MFIFSWNRWWRLHRHQKFYIPTGHVTFLSPLTLPMIDLCQRSWPSCFLCPGCSCSWPGWSLARRAPQGSLGHGGVWLCAGLPSVVSSMVSLKPGSHCTMILFQETRASCHSFVSANKKKHMENFDRPVWSSFLKEIVFFSLPGKEYSKGDSRYVMWVNAGWVDVGL